MAGSIAVLLVAIVLVAADVETVVALVALAGSSYVVYDAYRTSSSTRPVRSRLPTRLKRGLELVVALVGVMAVADQVDEGLWLAGMFAFGYTGYRSGRVLRGALYGAAVGVGSTVALVVLVGSLLLLASLLDVAGTRELLYQVLFAPGIVGFFTLLWSGLVVLLGGLTGLVSGGVGGAIARLL